VTVGASTAIFGILGGFIAFLIINWTELERFGPVRSTIACIMAFIIFISLLFSIGSSIDFIAHIGGLIGGIFISLAILPGIGLKNKLFVYVGAGGILIMNLVTILMLFLA
jgi:membrane associated rhomboid family serine protease